MKYFLIPLLFLALLSTGLSQLAVPYDPDNPNSELVDATTDKAVREFFKRMETAYNKHQAHRVAACFAEDAAPGAGGAFLAIVFSATVFSGTWAWEATQRNPPSRRRRGVSAG